MRIKQDNSVGSDINEITTLLWLLGGDWSLIRNRRAAEKVLGERVGRSETTDAIDQVNRGIVMGTLGRQWLQNNRGGSFPRSGWWTGRPDAAKAVCGSKNTPADLVVELGDGSLLGVSVKSTKLLYKDVGFKNRGIGTLGEVLGVDFQAPVRDLTSQAVSQLNLPLTNKARKPWVRTRPGVQCLTQSLGECLLGVLREMLLQKLLSMDQTELREHLLVHWLDCSGSPLPWIKITGGGSEGEYSAMITEPLESASTRELSSGDAKVSLQRLGTDTVGVSVGGRRLMRIRWKFESEKLCSPVKVSGEPWDTPAVS